MTKAVIYARYSSHNQTEQSIEGQLHDAYAFAERNGYQVIGEYIDRALTGTKDTRPDFQRMIRDAEKRAFQLVIVWKLDRFARNRYDSAIYKARLKKHGVRVVSVMENLTDGPEGIILEGILESMAEYYSANLSENVRRGLRESIAKGHYVGGHVPYGYRQEGTRLVADERTAPLAVEIFRRYAAGDRPSQIARDFNARGLHTRKGKAWTVGSFDGILCNPVYIGQYMFGGQVVPGVADALLDEETFRAAERRRQQNKRAPAAAKAPVRYQLQGKAFCGHCGAPMVGESGRGKGGTVYHYYACAAKKKRHTCKKKNEKKDFLEWYVCEQTVQYILAPERVDIIAGRVAEAYRREFGGSQIEALEKTVARLEADLNSLVDSLMVMPAAARPRIAARMEQLEAERSDAEADLARLRLASGIQLTAEQVKAWLRTFQRGDLMDEGFRQKIIDVFVNSVYVYDDLLVIYYNVRGGRQVAALGPENVEADLEGAEGIDVGSDLGGEGLLSPNKSEQPLYVFVRGLVGLVIRR